MATVRLGNHTKNHQNVQSALEDFCIANNLSQSSSSHLRLLLEEMFINVATYAYPDGTHGWVDVTFERQQQHAVIIIEDEGVPFNPLAKQLPDLTVDFNDREIGGLGIVLIRELADNVAYDFSDGRNRLRVAYKIT